MGTGPMNTHTVKVFDDEIGRLRGLISQMGGLAEDAIANAMKALQRNDIALAREVRAADKQIDAIEAEVERLAAHAARRSTCARSSPR
jgi:phosphate transport system protein